MFQGLGPVNIIDHIHWLDLANGTLKIHGPVDRVLYIFSYLKKQSQRINTFVDLKTKLIAVYLRTSSIFKKFKYWKSSIGGSRWPAKHNDRKFFLHSN